MKKIGVLNRELSRIIACMGHQDKLVVADAGLPIPKDVRCIDLAVRKGLPDFLSTVEAIASELEVERLILAEETASHSAHIGEGLRSIFSDTETETVTVTHETLKQVCTEALAVVRTGEFTPYANVVLVSGVVF